MSPFCKLADPKSYVACDWDLVRDDEARKYWVGFFKSHLNTILKLGIECAIGRDVRLEEVAARADRCRADFYQHFDRVGADPAAYGRVTILMLDAWRDQILRKHGFVDAFLDLKNRENEKMLPLLPAVCAEIDALGGASQIRALVEGVFAGNIFDMGAAATAKAFLGHSPDFFNTRKRLPARPWLLDDYDGLESRLLSNDRFRKVIYFIDNAGSDFLLGALPMIRWFARNGARVVIAANERPTLNDMTYDDVQAWWPRICAVEPSLGNLPIEIVSTGTGEPLIDLAEVSDALNLASRDAELVILEGMGRGVESNLDAIFSCPALNIAMIKDECIARRLNGNVFDVVCRFR